MEFLLCLIPVAIFLAGFGTAVLLMKYEVRPRRRPEIGSGTAGDSAGRLGGKQQWQP